MATSHNQVNITETGSPKGQSSKNHQNGPLAVPELLELVFSLSDNDVLFNSATVCRSWSALALDRLWAQLDSVFPLLKLVVSIDLFRDLDSPYSRSFQELSLALNRADWSRFQSYAKRIRSLSHDDIDPYRTDGDPPCLIPIATAMLCLHLPCGLAVLPNLKTLQWTTSRSMTSILPFLSPQLQTLDVELSGDSQTVNEFFTALAGRIPSLVTFILRTPTPARDVEDSLRRTIRTWTALETLELPPYYLRPSILETVTALPGLKALKQNYMHSPPVDQIAMLEQLPPTAFPVLEIFGFNGHPATSIRLIRDSEKLFSRLTSLHLNAVEGVGNANILELTSHVGEQCKHLEWLLLDLSLPAESPKEGISPLSHGVFENLLQCRRLREVQISHPYPVVFDASIVERMAAAWPKLTDFAITDVDLSLSIPDEWGNSLSILSTFAQYFPRLEALGLYFAETNETIFSGDLFSPFEFLEPLNLWVGVSAVPDGRICDAAFYIASVCAKPPSLSKGVSCWYVAQNYLTSGTTERSSGME